MAKLSGRGGIGILYDECRHLFSEGTKSNRVFLDSFKSMMILSGVSLLTKYAKSCEQRDKDELVMLLLAFADKVDVDIEKRVTPDFWARLDHAYAHRRGLFFEENCAGAAYAQLASAKATFPLILHSLPDFTG